MPSGEGRNTPGPPQLLNPTGAKTDPFQAIPGKGQKLAVRLRRVQVAPSGEVRMTPFPFERVSPTATNTLPFQATPLRNQSLGVGRVREVQVIAEASRENSPSIPNIPMTTGVRKY